MASLMNAPRDWRCGIELGAGKRLHVSALDAELVEQLLQAELRMLGMLGRDLVPALVVERLIEAGKHDGARTDARRRRASASTVAGIDPVTPATMTTRPI